MAQTTHLASFGPVLVIANFHVVYYNCKYLKNDPPTRICSEDGSLWLWLWLQREWDSDVT